MSMQFNCPSCQRVIGAEVAPGTQVRCPLCGQVVTVPGPTGAAAMPGVMPYGAARGAPSTSLAIGALVCGIAGLVACPLVGVVGLVLGIVATRRIRRQPEQYGGKGLAVGGIITGVLSILSVPLIIAFIVVVVPRFTGVVSQTACTVNMTEIGQALYSYAQQEPNGAFPEAGADWQARLMRGGSLNRTQFMCPLATQSWSKTAYTYVPGYGTKANPKQIILYEAIENHNGKGGNILYADGQVQFVNSPQYEQAIAAIKQPDGTAWKEPKEEPKAGEEEEEEEH